MGGHSSKDEYKEAEWTWVPSRLLVQSFQDKVKMADKSMTSLAHSIDTMHAIAGFLTRYLKSSQSESLEDVADTVQLSSNVDDKHMALQLLSQIEKRVIPDKQYALESLHDILHLIKTAIQENSNAIVFHDFSIDKYLEMSPDTKNIRRFYDKNIAAMEKEIKLLTDEKKNLSAENTCMTEAKKSLEKEKRTLTQIQVNLVDRIKLLEQINTDNETKLEKLMANESTLQIDLEECTHAIESLQCQYKEVENKNESLEMGRDSLTMEYNIIIEKIEKQYAETVTDVKVEEQKDKTNEKRSKSVLDQMDETYDQMKKMYEIETGIIQSNKCDLEKQKKKVIEEKRKLQTAVKEMKLLEATNTEHAHKNNSLNLQLLSIMSEKKSLHEKIAYETGNNRTINLQKDHDISEKNRQIYDLKQDNMVLHQSITETEEANNKEIKRLEDEYSTVNKELKSLTLIKKDQDRQEQSNEVKIEQLITDRKERIANEGNMQRRKTILENQLLKVQQECEQLKTECVRASDIIKSLKNSNEYVLQDNERMKQELERIKRKKLFQVQLYYQRRGGLMGTVEENLVQLLRSKMESDTVELEFIKCMESADIQLDKPLLLLCISASRIGTDAANAIQGLTLTPKMSLLIFHHKDEHALPNQASYQVLTGQNYKMLGGIYDLAFLAERGIYSCAMNSSSVTSVMNFISTEGANKQTDNQ